VVIRHFFKPPHNKGVNPTRLSPQQSAAQCALEVVFRRRCFPRSHRAGYARTVRPLAVKAVTI
jgi:hypothetical protein